MPGQYTSMYIRDDMYVPQRAPDYLKHVNAGRAHDSVYSNLCFRVRQGSYYLIHLHQHYLDKEQEETMQRKRRRAKAGQRQQRVKKRDAKISNEPANEPEEMVHSASGNTHSTQYLLGNESLDTIPYPISPGNGDETFTPGMDGSADASELVEDTIFVSSNSRSTQEERAHVPSSVTYLVPDLNPDRPSSAMSRHSSISISDAEEMIAMDLQQLSFRSFLDAKSQGEHYVYFRSSSPDSDHARSSPSSPRGRKAASKLHRCRTSPGELKNSQVAAKGLESPLGQVQRSTSLDSSMLSAMLGSHKPTETSDSGVTMPSPPQIKSRFAKTETDQAVSLACQDFQQAQESVVADNEKMQVQQKRAKPAESYLLQARRNGPRLRDQAKPALPKCARGSRRKARGQRTAALKAFLAEPYSPPPIPPVPNEVPRPPKQPVRLSISKRKSSEGVVKEAPERDYNDAYGKAESQTDAYPGTSCLVEPSEGHRNAWQLLADELEEHEATKQTLEELTLELQLAREDLDTQNICMLRDMDESNELFTCLARHNRELRNAVMDLRPVAHAIAQIRQAISDHLRGEDPLPTLMAPIPYSAYEVPDWAASEAIQPSSLDTLEAFNDFARELGAGMKMNTDGIRVDAEMMIACAWGEDMEDNGCMVQ